MWFRPHLYGLQYPRQPSPPRQLYGAFIWNLTSANARSARPGYTFDKMVDGRKEIKVVLNILFILFSDCSVVDGSWCFYGTTFEGENQSGNVDSPRRIETERVCLSSQTKTEYTCEGHAHIENICKEISEKLARPG